MKTIAIVTMIFLPRAYVAASKNIESSRTELRINALVKTRFSMTMFNWQAQNGQVLSSHFWIYWAVTVPVTLLVLLVWVLWARPWK